MEKPILNEMRCREEFGLFKFGIISKLISSPSEFKSKEDFFRFASTQVYEDPMGKKVSFSPTTIKRWYLQYKHNGLEGLVPRKRSDIGASRRLEESCADKIKELQSKYPHITGKAIYQKLIEDGYIKKQDVSIDTLYRFLNSKNLKELHTQERVPFELEFANECWQADTSHGPVLNVNRSKLQTYLIQIIDDASRLVVGSKFFFNDNAFNFQCVLKDAITIYGVPKRLFLDNGKPYKNHQLKLICANIGTELLYARPYSPESKRKIERSFRTIKDNFINCTDWNDFTTIDELNEKFKEYLNSSYQNEVHSSLGMSPNKRYMKDINRIKTIEDKKFLTECFFHTDEKRVSTDCTITLSKIRFEVPPKYLKQRVLIKYLPTDNSYAYIVNPNNKTWEKILPVDKVANSKRKRQSLSYDKKREDLTNV